MLWFLMRQGKVRKPRMTKFVHNIRANDTQAVSQQVVTLTLQDQESPAALPAPASKVSKTLAHSVSSPALQGAWSMKTLENAISPLPIKRSGTYYIS